MTRGIEAGEASRVAKAAEEDVETGLGKAVVTDPVISHMLSVLNVKNSVTTHWSVAAT